MLNALLLPPPERRYCPNKAAMFFTGIRDLLTTVAFRQHDRPAAVGFAVNRHKSRTRWWGCERNG